MWAVTLSTHVLLCVKHYRYVTNNHRPLPRSYNYDEEPLEERVGKYAREHLIIREEDEQGFGFEGGFE